MTWTEQNPSSGEATVWDGGSTTWDSGATTWDGGGASWSEQSPTTGTWTEQAAS